VTQNAIFTFKMQWSCYLPEALRAAVCDDGCVSRNMSQHK